jgi:putative ABC transport system substrate-binding protein
MTKKVILIALCSLLLAQCSAVEAQQAKKTPRIGSLAATKPAAVATRIAAFQQGLRELGYIEGKNIIIEWRSAEGKIDRLPALAAELARLNVDVIVTTGSTPTPSRQGSNFYDTHRHGAR